MKRDLTLIVLLIWLVGCTRSGRDLSHTIFNSGASGPDGVITSSSRDSGGEGSGQGTMGLTRTMVAYGCVGNGVSSKLAGSQGSCNYNQFVYSVSGAGSAGPTYYLSDDPSVLHPESPIGGRPVTVATTITLAGKTILGVQGQNVPFESTATAGYAPPGAPAVDGYAQLVCRNPSGPGTVLVYHNTDDSRNVVVQNNSLTSGFVPASYTVDSSGNWVFQFTITHSGQSASETLIYYPAQGLCSIQGTFAGVGYAALATP